MRGSAELLELAQDDLKRRNLARVGLANHDRGVADRQRRMHVVDELDRSRAIEEGQPVAHVVDAGDIGLDAHGVAARLLARVADGGPVADRALPRQRSAARQYPFEEAGFSALERPDDGDETRTGDAVLVMDSSQYPAPSSGARGGRAAAFPWTRKTLAIARAAANARVALLSSC